MRDIKSIVSQMTLKEKATMLSGADFWHLYSIERLGIDPVMVSDGPHGLRKQEEGADQLGMNESIKAVCFPTAVGTASSFNRELLKSLGETLGEECQAEGVSILLGPAVNIKRSPLCGRNFEYFSEDPFLAGELAASYINGVQSKDIGTSIKHFAANNQEKRRNTVSSAIDERTLREIYFPAFETAVKKAQPYTVMCSYNRINGVYSSENDWLLNKILRKDWGFEGYVMSDWGAVSNRIDGIPAGLDLEMPSSFGLNTERVMKALESGKSKEEDLDKACERILNISFKYIDNKTDKYIFDRDKDHEKAHKAATETMVLLKNDGILPLDKKKKIAFIGEFAEKPRYQGGGSSHINSHKVTSALEAVAGITKVTYSKGFSSQKDEYDASLASDAVFAAKNADIAVIFAGLPECMESEGFDRKHLNLPSTQNKIIRDIAAVQKNVVVVLHNGSPVLMPWLDDVSGVLESYLGGEAVGSAQVDLLFGKVNPSAKLAETFPLTLADTPSFGNFPGTVRTVEYREGIFVGYRYYDKAGKDVLFPFGYGLSYTTFEYSDLKISKKTLKAGGEVAVSFKVKNTGKVSGAEIAQIYVACPEVKAFKAPKELKEFSKVFLKPGEEKEISVVLPERAFSFWNTSKNDWDCENGKHEILVGASSRDIRLTGEITLSGYDDKSVYSKKAFKDYYNGDVRAISDGEFEKLLGFEIPEKYFPDNMKYTLYNSFEDAQNTKWGARINKVIRTVAGKIGGDAMGNSEMTVACVLEMPLGEIAAMSMGIMTEEMALAVVDLWNGKSAAKSFNTLISGGFGKVVELIKSQK